MGPDAMILVFWMLSFQPTCSLSSFSFIKRFLSSSSLSAIRVVSSAWIVKVKVTQSCQTLWDPRDYTVHGILQARILECVAFPSSRGSSQPRDQTQVSCIASRLLTNWAIREAYQSSAYLRLLIFLLAVLIPVCDSSSPAFCMIYSAYKLNKQVTIYSLDILLSQFGTSWLFHVQF